MLYMNAEKYGVVQACHFESVNEGALLVEPDRVILTPTGQAIAAMSHHAGAVIRAIQDDVVATEKDDIITLTLINRSYDQEKTFTMPKAGIISSAVLLSGEDILPWSRFSRTALPVREEEGSYCVTLPEHSIAALRLKLR